MKLTLNLKNYQSYILTGLIIFGPIKAIFNGLILNVDLTLIILGIAFFDFLINIRKLSVKKHSFFFLLLLFGIWLLMLFSIPYSSSSIISYDKFFKFTIPIFCFIYPLVVERIEISVFYKLHAFGTSLNLIYNDLEMILYPYKYLIYDELLSNSAHEVLTLLMFKNSIFVTVLFFYLLYTLRKIIFFNNLIFASVISGLFLGDQVFSFIHLYLFLLFPLSSNKISNNY